MVAWIFDFPIKSSFDIKKIDDFIKLWKNAWKGFFNGIKNFLEGIVVGIQTGLEHIPWIILFVGVFLIGFLLEKKLA